MIVHFVHLSLCKLLNLLSFDKFVVLCRQLNKIGQAIATVGTELFLFFYKLNTKCLFFLPKIDFHKWGGGLHFFLNLERGT